MRLHRRALIDWLRSHPEALALPAVPVVLASLSFDLSVGLLPLAALVAATAGAFVLARRQWPGRVGGARLHARLAVQMLALGLVAYGTGWGAALSLVFVIAVADNVRLSGSEAARPALDWALAAIALGQLGIQLGLPSFIDRPAVHGVAVVGALVLGVATSRIHLLTSRMEVAEAEVSARERRFRSLVARSSDVTLVIDAEGVVRYPSPSSAFVLGYDETDLLGQRLEELIHPADLDRVQHQIEDLLRDRGRGLIECRVRHAEGRWVTVESNCHDLRHDPDVGGIVLNARDVSDRKQLEAQLHHRAFHDGLTGLANRHLFRDRVAHAVARSQRNPSPFAVLVLDLDGFKDVNDSLGHQAGDALLKVVADRLGHAIRDHDTAARLGGDEFAVLLEDLTGQHDAARVAERVLSELRAPIEVEDTSVTIGASIGIAVNEQVVRTPDANTRSNTDALLRDADIAMYIAKGAGRGRYEIFQESMHVAVVERLQVERDLQRAVDEHQLELHYQPIVTLADGTIVSVEALLRWHHPTRGLISPAEFIPVAEETGAIVPIGRWVLLEATRQVARWQAEFGTEPALTVSVNVSPRQISHGDVAHDVATALALSGLAPEHLTLEVTESALLQDVDKTKEVMAALKNLGVRLAVDDFGTGYSSLAYLQNFPFDVLKIDRAFIDGLTSGEQNPAVVRAIIDLGRSLELDTVAEGIEYDEQLSRFRDLNCNLGQGYLFARPSPAAELSAMLGTRRTPHVRGGRAVDAATVGVSDDEVAARERRPA